MDAKGKAVRGRRREEFRPTLARVRDAVFNSLRGRVGGARVLDLYAGSGALGIEALRQGAERAVFVEHNAKLVTEIRRRLIGEEVADRAEVWRRDALAAVRDLGLAGKAFEIIFLDPPYGRRLIAATLRVIGTAGILAPGGVVAIADNSEKEGLFSVSERLEMLRAATSHLRNVQVDAFTGLTVTFAQTKGAGVLVKGLRAVVDFEYELKQASMNQRLAPSLDTVFFMTAPSYYFLSSTLIREVARLGGAVTGLVPQAVEERLRKKFSGKHLLKGDSS